MAELGTKYFSWTIFQIFNIHKQNNFIIMFKNELEALKNKTVIKTEAEARWEPAKFILIRSTENSKFCLTAVKVDDANYSQSSQFILMYITMLSK
jgi:hypothetical protein